MVSKGWPPDIAMAMDDNYRTAFCIQHGEMLGRTWDWQAMGWKAPPKRPKR